MGKLRLMKDSGPSQGLTLSDRAGTLAPAFVSAPSLLCHLSQRFKFCPEACEQEGALSHCKCPGQPASGVLVIWEK